MFKALDAIAVAAMISVMRSLEIVNPCGASWDRMAGDARVRHCAAYGNERPIADNATSEGRQQNRRVEFQILNREPRCAVPESPTQP